MCQKGLLVPQDQQEKSYFSRGKKLDRLDVQDVAWTPCIQSVHDGEEHCKAVT
jgi:hypothetical protein